mmetsp:Transcript_50774/g.146477  ORF Transcript_50774/g.146477 Transcript_50774/m.146477 type:complete len:382 (+) Transcript_50774:182-1327(+)
MAEDSAVRRLSVREGYQQDDFRNLDDASGDYSGDSCGMPRSEDSTPPLCYGEQLVLETFIRCRQRPFNRQRQDELAKPKKALPPTQASMGMSMEFIGGPAPTADRTKIASIVGRLSQPKRPPPSTGHGGGSSMVLQQDADNKRKNVDMVGLINRLSAPKPPKPPVGDIMLSPAATGTPRSINMDRLHALAKPAKRGASCRSWGVHPEWARDVSSSAATTPRSRTSEGGSGGLRAAGGQIAGAQHQQQRQQQQPSPPVPPTSTIAPTAAGPADGAGTSRQWPQKAKAAPDVSSSFSGGDEEAEGLGQPPPSRSRGRPAANSGRGAARLWGGDAVADGDDFGLGTLALGEDEGEAGGGLALEGDMSLAVDDDDNLADLWANPP